MKNAENQLELKLNVLSFNANALQEASIQTLVQFFQEAAWLHAEKLNYGSDLLAEKNLAWVLSDLKLEIFRYPKWQEEIIVRTWFCGIRRIFAARDFEFYSNKYELLGHGSSNWFIIDINTRKPKRPEIYNEMMKYVYPKNIMDNITTNIEFNEPLNEIDKRKIHFSDIDWNRHVNNTNYLAFLSNALGEKFNTENIITNLYIKYLSELKYNQEVVILESKKNTEISYFRFLNLNTNKSAAEIEIMYKKRK